MRAEALALLLTLSACGGEESDAHGEPMPRAVLFPDLDRDGMQAGVTEDGELVVQGRLPIATAAPSAETSVTVELTPDRVRARRCDPGAECTSIDAPRPLTTTTLDPLFAEPLVGEERRAVIRAGRSVPPAELGLLVDVLRNHGVARHAIDLGPADRASQPAPAHGP